MIYIKTWSTWNRKTREKKIYKGVFLLGIIPLYVRRYTDD